MYPTSPWWLLGEAPEPPRPLRGQAVRKWKNGSFLVLVKTKDVIINNYIINIFIVVQTRCCSSFVKLLVCLSAQWQVMQLFSCLPIQWISCLCVPTRPVRNKQMKTENREKNKSSNEKSDGESQVSLFSVVVVATNRIYCNALWEWMGLNSVFLSRRNVNLAWHNTDGGKSSPLRKRLTRTPVGFVLNWTIIVL